MKSFIKSTIIFTILYLATSCSKGFLNENLTQDSFPLGLSNIYISPDWQSADYLFKLPSVKDGDYEIVSKPSWLNVGSTNGHLSDSIAVVQCSAKKNSDFSSVGVYTDFMTVSAGGQQYKVPVAYITEGNPKVKVQSDLTLSYSSNGNPYLPIQNTGMGVLVWKIISMPEWLILDTARLESQGMYISYLNSYNIPLRFNLDNVSKGNVTGKIVLSTNDKEQQSVTINVTAELGNPKLSIYTKNIDFSFTETSITLGFGNIGNGRLTWKFTDIPEWLTITPSSGIYGPYTSSLPVVFSCDRTKLSPGQNSVTVNLQTNDNSYPSYSIKVTAIAPGIFENVRAVDGNITDAVFNKNTNTLYYITSAPNKFIAYDVIRRTMLNEIPLSKAPTCLAISEDWTKAAVGLGGYISAINLPSNTVTSVYPVNYSVNDIAWAENDWFCYTQKGGSFSGLHWINIANGALYDDTNKTDLDGSSIVKKVPNQPYLIATRNGTSPSGFLAYDIATKSRKSYAHMDLTNFWFSENGDYIFGKYLYVYRTTSSTGSTDPYNTTINAIGKINVGIENYYGLQYLYHSNNYLWVLQNESYSFDVSPTSLYQVEDNDYTLVKEIGYYVFCQPDAQTTPFIVSANYVFANMEGTEVTVLCKDINSSAWVMEFIPVK